MPDPVFRTDDEWRAAIIAQVIKLQLSVYELACVIVVIAVGAFLDRWWSYSLLVCAIVALAYLIFAWRSQERDFRRLANLASKVNP